MASVDLVSGEQYWVLVNLDHDQILGKPVYEAVKLCVLDLNNPNKEDEGTDGLGHKYNFYPVNSNEKDFCYTLDWWVVNRLVFNSIDEYLYRLVIHVGNINMNENQYSFDDFLKNKIIESQNNNPEVWI